MSLLAYHFHGSVAVILSKTAQNLLIKAATENTNERASRKKNIGGRHEEAAFFFFVFFFKLEYPLQPAEKRPQDGQV